MVTHDTAFKYYKGVITMSSWKRGRENEEIGEQQMQSDDLGEKIEGAGRKIAGEVEQGIDNVGDTLSGKQRDLSGDMRNATDDADRWMERTGQEVRDSTDAMHDKARDQSDRVTEWASERGEDLDRATDRAGDWVQERGEDIKRAGETH
jgi:hypothetical protein